MIQMLILFWEALTSTAVDETSVRHALEHDAFIPKSQLPIPKKKPNKHTN